MAEINVTDASGKQPRKIGYIKNQPENTNLLETTSFKLIISKIPETTFFCQSVNLPGIGIEKVEQQTIFNPLLYPGGKVTHQNFIAKFIVSESVNNWLEIYKWIKSCSTEKDFEEIVPLDKSLVSDASLYILTSKNNLNLEVRFFGLFPVNLDSIELDYSDSELQTIVSSVEFAFTYYEIHNPS